MKGVERLEVSIVIPTHNKAVYLELTLESLFHQSSSKSEYEVIVVDNGCTDRTSAVVERIAGRDWNLHYLKLPTSGRSLARNAGIRAARGNIILFVDDDCLCDRNLIAVHRARYSNVRKKVVRGVGHSIVTRVPLDRKRLIDELKSIIYTMNHPVPALAVENIADFLPDTLTLLSAEDIANNSALIQQLSILQDRQNECFSRVALEQCSCSWHFFMTQNVSVDRDSLLKVGLFDESFQGWGEEDPELGYRLFRAGVQFDATQEAIIYHQIHPRDKVRGQEEWLHNYIKFAEKHNAPEIYLRWQLVKDVITFSQYESIVQQIVDGLLSERDRRAIKERYDQFLAENMQLNVNSV
jgi:glycosyltransferase involved in cell wall biosynthesis